MRRQRPSPGGRDPTSALVGGRAPWHAAAFVLALAAGSWPVIRQLGSASGFDEGVYLDSLRSLEHGHVLGRDVFASQPPGFYDLLRLAAFVVPSSEHALRLVFASLTVVGIAAVFVTARAFGSTLAGVFAALLLGASPPAWGVGAHVSPDAASTSLAAVGLALAAVTWARPRRRATTLTLSALAGCSIGLAASVKLSALTVLLGVAAFCVALRPTARSIAVLVGAGLAPAAVLLAVHHSALSQLWRDAVVLHENARGLAGSQLTATGGSAGVVANLGQIAHAFLPRTQPALWLLVLGCGLTLARALRSRDRRILALLAWPAVSAIFLDWQRPLFAHHDVLVAAAASAPAGVGLAWAVSAAGTRSSRRGLAVGATTVLVVAAVVVQAVRSNVPRTPPAVGKAIAMMSQATPQGSYVLAASDPIVAFASGAQVPPDLVDTSWVRIFTHSLTGAEVMRDLRIWHVRAVLVERRLRRWPSVMQTLDRGFPRRYTLPDAVLFVR